MTHSDPKSPDPDSGANQDDAAWLDLVARLEQTDSGLAPEPAAGGEGTGGEETGADGTDGDAAGKGGAGTGAAGDSASPRRFSDFDPLGLAAPGPGPTPGSAPASRGAAGTGPRDYEADDGDGEFVPEEPPKLSDTDPLTMLAWIGAVGGPIALLLSVMFWRSAPLLAIIGMVAAFAVSVVYLITKLPHEKDEYDDGARV
ncbi:hypothetical protein ACRQ5B_16245 [Pseudarthrobacter sp. L19]|uniref:hypothetical protein n=1 Tax=Pseudarthrobacter sp. L19 TaxID=3423951 RepID=UPI003D79DD59